MLGWINDCAEKLIIAKYGLNAWHLVKQKAGCKVPDGGFFKLDHYADESTLDLVQAAAHVSGLTVPGIFEALGTFFVSYISDQGYESLLCCQGSTLRDFMTNINAIHQHLQTTFPKKMIMPEFWCEYNADDSSLTLHYCSRRGNHLAPLAVGLVREVAVRQFELDIVMNQTAIQGVGGSKFTSWHVTTRDPKDMWKLTKKKGGHNGKVNDVTSLQCPFTGMSTTLPPGMNLRNEGGSEECPGVVHDDSLDTSSNVEAWPSKPPAVKRCTSMGTTSTQHSQDSSSMDFSSNNKSVTASGSLSAEVTQKIFPYHVVVDFNFIVTQVGHRLSRLIKTEESEMVGQPIDQVLWIRKPINANWTWDWLRKLEDQKFEVEPVDDNLASICFMASVVHTGSQAMLILSPDAKNLNELRSMGLTLSDLPSHGAYRDAVFLREHLSTQMNNALKMEKLSRTLEREKALLEELLPEHAAEGLRNGRAVEPMNHPHVTMFFSDVVGFTDICKEIYPWEVIAMLNRLYSIMDFLAKRFELFKVETIGDAYVCCSGLPHSDPHHARRVANFAVAVQHCSQMVLSPANQAPIRLRIGIHTGSCASGVVGATNPRYCVFGDLVNTTARHESTGLPGKIHCSRVTQMELKATAFDQFDVKLRGFVEMKGKGKLQTFWLDATQENGLVNEPALDKLKVEVQEMLHRSDARKSYVPESSSSVTTVPTDDFISSSLPVEQQIDGPVSPIANSQSPKKICAHPGNKKPKSNTSRKSGKSNERGRPFHHSRRPKKATEASMYFL